MADLPLSSPRSYRRDPNDDVSPPRRTLGGGAPARPAPEMTWEGDAIRPDAPAPVYPATSAAPPPAAPVAPAGAPASSPAAPARRSVLPDGVARYSGVGDSQIYIGRGANGEPVFSDTVEGAQNVNPFTGRARSGNGAVPASLDAADPLAGQRRALASLRAGGGLIGDAPDSYRQPVAPTGRGADQGAMTDGAIARLRRAPGGDTEFNPNSANLNPQDVLHLNPQSRQALIERTVASNADPNLDPETRASNRALLERIDTAPRAGAYNPTGYGGNGAFPGGGLTPAQLLNFSLRSQREQREALQNERDFARKGEETAQTRAEDVFQKHFDNLKDSVQDPTARRRIASVTALKDLFDRDPNFINSEAAKEGIGNLFAISSRALHPRGLFTGDAPGVPTGGLNPGSPLTVEENTGLRRLVSGSDYTLATPYVKPDGKGNWVPAQPNEPGATRNTYGHNAFRTGNEVDPEFQAIFGKRNENLAQYKRLLDAISARQQARNR